MSVTLDHTEGNALSFSDSSPAKGVTGWASIDAGDGSYFEYVRVQLNLAFAAGIDGDATIKVRYSADSGTTDGDTNIDLFDVTYNAGGSVVFTFKLTQFNFAEIGVYNGTESEAELTITAGKWEGVKVTDS